jgi:hypothetical protein
MPGESLSRGAETRPRLVEMTMMRPLPGSADGLLGFEDETGPCNGVKGAVDAYDPPLEARVPRLDRCCLKQKVGYSRDTAPKNNW